MKTFALALLASAASALPAFAADAAITAAYQDVLQRGLTPGPDGVLLFDYAAAAGNGDHEVVEAFIADQAMAAPSAMSETDALAYWANLYNAVTLDVVLDAYPIRSIRQFGTFNTGPWDRDVVTVEGETLSLNDIEHGKMRGQYPSPYIHYMVNCASIGCPNLLPDLWSGDTLDADQKRAARAYVNSDRGLSWTGRTLGVSKIYKWYADDFGTRDELRAHLATYAEGDKRDALVAGKPFRSSHYDWDLNETPR